MTTAKTPAVIRKYIEEYGGDEAEVREYIHEQRAFFGRLKTGHTDFASWMAFKLGCTPKQAEIAIKWAESR